MLTPLTPRRAGVLGSPVSHSLSPVLHRAAYAALGLTGWTYDATRVEADDLADHVGQLGEDWVGLSLTMPLKEEGLRLAGSVSALARSTGAVNTLVRQGSSWWGDNTDVHGVVAALAGVGVVSAEHVVVIGSGATARSVVAAAAILGAGHVTFMVRSGVRPETRAQVRAAGLHTEVVGEGDWPSGVDVVVSTVPPSSTAPWAQRLPPGGRALLDVVYGDGPTPLAAAAAARGYAAVPGTEMLLHQGARQVELMTGLDAPVGAMRAALAAALSGAPAAAANAGRTSAP